MPLHSKKECLCPLQKHQGTLLGIPKMDEETMKNTGKHRKHQKNRDRLDHLLSLGCIRSINVFVCFILFFSVTGPERLDLQWAYRYSLYRWRRSGLMDSGMPKPLAFVLLVSHVLGSKMEFYREAVAFRNQDATYKTCRNIKTYQTIHILHILFFGHKSLSGYEDVQRWTTLRSQCLKGQDGQDGQDSQV